MKCVSGKQGRRNSGRAGRAVKELRAMGTREKTKKSLPITVFMRLLAAAYKVFFFVISYGLLSRTVTIWGGLQFFLQFIIRSRRRSVFSWLRFVAQNLYWQLSVLSSASRARSVTGGIMMNRRQLWCEHHCQGCQ